MVRMNLARQSDPFQEAKKLPKGKLRNQVFQSNRTAYRYCEYDIQAYVTIVANQSDGLLKIDSHTSAKTAGLELPGKRKGAASC